LLAAAAVSDADDECEMRSILSLLTAQSLQHVTTSAIAEARNSEFFSDSWTASVPKDWNSMPYNVHLSIFVKFQQFISLVDFFQFLYC